jgi:glycosyltransferase involved in cell wall biosynthesis
MAEGPPRVLHLSTFDCQGGAALAAFRLNRALRELGVASRMKVQLKLGDDPLVSAPEGRAAKLRDAVVSALDRAPLAMHRARARTSFDLQWIGSGSASSIKKLAADVVHLHWVAGGFLGIGALGRLGSPLVWTLHDMWPFTGGCHVSGDCERYRERCGRCWQLGSTASRDLTRGVWRRKQRAWRDADLSVVAPSRWMAECAGSSSLFRDRPISVIPNGVNTSIFKPLNQAWARTCLGMDPDRPVILFGGSSPIADRNKGFATLIEAIHIARRGAELAGHELVVFGCGEPAQAPDVGLPTRYLGRLADEVALAVAYNASDLMVVPSRQESFCQTAAEALACGIPVVAFDATGPRDIIDHRVTGYLAKPYEAEDFAHGMIWVLRSEAKAEMARQARKMAVQRFDLASVARRHADLYQAILDR